MKTNHENYKWGIFYFNAKDLRVIVPKANQFFGWTLNFASPWTYIILVCFIALLIFTSTF